MARNVSQRNVCQRRNALFLSQICFENIELDLSSRSKLRYLKIMRSYLVKKNFNPIIFISSALKYQIDHPTELIRLINIYNIIEVEGGIDDDKHLIEEAFRKKIKIISNDKFNEYLNDYNGKSWELKKNILGFKILDGRIILLEK